MPALQLTHPYPTAALPAGIDPDSVDSVRRFIREHHFPSGQRGEFLFAYSDEDQLIDEVFLRHGLAGHRQPPKFTRCAGGAHLLQLHAPAVNRIEYAFNLVNAGGEPTSTLDPLNPDTVRDPFAQKSVVVTREYRPPDYIVDPPPAARGSLAEIAIDGPIGKPWPTWIWSPPAAHKHDTALPVIVFLDGGDWLTLASARNILENLTHTRTIAPCRAVFMKPSARNDEYAANPRTAAFLANDLPRMLAEHIPWPQEAQHRIAVGVSLGALCLLHTHRTQPAPAPGFGKLILQSGSFFQPETDAMETKYINFGCICDFVNRVRQDEGMAASARPPHIPIHMTCGAGEENIVNNRAMANTLREQGYPITFHEQPDAHNWTCWRDSIGEGLRRMLA